MVLQYVVREDGTVGSIAVVRSTRAGCGFEGAAAKAVRRRRYLPATRNGEPCDTYLMFVVTFDPAGKGETRTGPAEDLRPDDSADQDPDR